MDTVFAAHGGGWYWDHRQGIALGCPLSPVVGAFYLSALDAELEYLGYFWTRFMDDILVLAPSRWKLRKAVRVVNRVLARLKLVKHLDKTFIGRIAKGFDWLGHLRPGRLSVARQTLDRFLARARRLYEQHVDTIRMGDYVQRWWRWFQSGLGRAVKNPMALPGRILDGEQWLILCDYKLKLSPQISNIPARLRRGRHSWGGWELSF